LSAFRRTKGEIFEIANREISIMKKTSRHVLAALFPLLLAAAMPVTAAETPTSLPGGKVVSADEAKTLVGKAHFFDMRKAINFGKGHVKGAVALPYDEKSEKASSFDASKDGFDKSKLPSDKNAVLVFYSDGPSGWKSYKAAVLAIRAGHKNVMWMRGGITEWSAKGQQLE
jgi:rhodanese-related sulfurtransferase